MIRLSIISAAAFNAIASATLAGITSL